MTNPRTLAEQLRELADEAERRDQLLTRAIGPANGESLDARNAKIMREAASLLLSAVEGEPATISLRVQDDALGISAMLDDSQREREMYHRLVLDIRHALGDNARDVPLLELPAFIAARVAPSVPSQDEEIGREVLASLRTMVAAYDGTDDVLGPSMRVKLRAARAALLHADEHASRSASPSPAPAQE